MPKAEYITWQGGRFEGAGVKPDVYVSWAGERLIAGTDQQLQFALMHLFDSKADDAPS
jgi:C-terminal processing protease CtpA/Prc